MYFLLSYKFIKKFISHSQNLELDVKIKNNLLKLNEFFTF